MSSGNNTKECPFCRETIKAEALRCRYCYADLTGAATASAAASLTADAALSAFPTTFVPPPPTALEPLQVFDLLAHLVDRNLVVYEVDADGQGRYRLLETVRQYACDRLSENEEAHALRPRHRDHFLALAEEASTKLNGPKQKQWLDTLESEHDNLRAALEGCLDNEEEGAQAGLRLAGALSIFWWTRGHFSEGRERYTALLSRPGAQEWTKGRAGALHGAGTLAHMQGDYASARALLEQSLAIGREIGDKQGMANSLNNLGNMANEQGDYASARALLEESLAIRREEGDKRGMATSLNGLGNVAGNQGDYASGRFLYEESLAIQREIGDKRGMAASLSNLGLVAGNQGDTASARALYEESLAIQREVGDRRGTAMSLVNLGPLACQERDYAASRSCFAECLTLCLALGEKRVTAYALEGCAVLATAREQPERAVCLYGASDALRAAIGVPLSPNERDEVDRAVAALRATLGEPTFNRAGATGRVLTWEQAIEYARDDETP